MEAETLPPFSEAAERGVLGGTLRWPAALDEIAGVLDVASFYLGHHRDIYQAMLTLHRAGKPVDTVSVFELLRGNGQFNFAGYLAELWDTTPTGANVAYHAQIVADRAVRRRLIQIANEVARDAQDGVSPAEDLLSDAEVRLSQLRLAGSRSQLPPTMQEVVAETMQRIDRRASQQDAGALMSGFSQLDAMTAGFQGGELICIAARTSVGKTSMAQAFATNFAKAGKRGLFVTLEMSRLDIAQRFLVEQSNIQNWVIRSPQHVGNYAEDLGATAEKLAKFGIRIDDEAGLTVTRLASKARVLRRKGELDWLILDYLGLLVPENKKLMRHEQVSTMSRSLKMLAQELEVPIFMLCQLNRSADESNDPPRLSSLRESGSIEQDSSMVIMLHRPFDERPPRDQAEAIDLIMAKNRQGETGTIRLSYMGSYFRFQGDIPKL